MNTTGMHKHEILFVCHECDALQKVEDLDPGEVANCACCGNRLFRQPKGGIDRPLALALGTLILYVIANVYPVMTVTIAGISQSATLTDSALIFLHLGEPELAAVVWLPTVFIPGFILCAMIYVLLAILSRRRWPLTRPALTWVGRLLPWGMADVFLLGVLVALVKLVALADITLDTGFYALLGLIFLYAATVAAVEPHVLWEHLDRLAARARQRRRLAHA